MVECAELSEDAKEHLAHTPWKQMSLAERIETTSWITLVDTWDKETEVTGTSVRSQCATDLNINLDGEL